MEGEQRIRGFIYLFFFGGNDPRRINHIEVDGEKQKNKVKLLFLFLNVMNCVRFQLAMKMKKKLKKLVEIFIVTLTGCQEMFLVSTSLLLHSLSLHSPSPTLSQPKKIIQTQTNKKIREGSTMKKSKRKRELNFPKSRFFPQY